jgi:phosphohistidine phosphatase
VPPDDENALFEQVLEKFPTAAFAMLELAIDRWEDCVPGCGRLTHFARPRDLDPQLGPEKVS